MTWMPDHVVVAVDGSEASNHAARVGVSLAEHRGGKVTLVTVVRPPAGSTAVVGSDVLVAIGAAVRAREVLRFDYDRGEPARDLDQQPVAPRRVEPHHLVTWRGRWYLVGWDLDREEWRTAGLFP